VWTKSPGDGEVDLRALDAGDGDADHLAAGGHHRAAGVARVHAAVDLHLHQMAPLLAQAGDRRLADGDALAQRLAEGEAEDVHLLRLYQTRRRPHLQRLRQAHLVVGAEDREVGRTLEALEGSWERHLVGLAAVLDHVDPLGRAAVGLEHPQDVSVGEDDPWFDAEEAAPSHDRAVAPEDAEQDGRLLDFLQHGLVELSAAGRGLRR
jgi:hypothetical protein